MILSHRQGLSLTIEELDIEANYEDEGDDVYEVDEKTDTKIQHESIIDSKDVTNISKMKSSELEERLMMIIMSLESLLGRSQMKTKFTTFLSNLVEEYKEEQKLGKGKGITIQDTLNALRCGRITV